MDLQITFLSAEVGLDLVYLRLAGLPDERARARHLKAALPVASAYGQLPIWFLSLPPTTQRLPRSMTIRLSLSELDPAVEDLIQKLRSLPERDRIIAIKTVFTKACAAGSDPALKRQATKQAPSPAAAVADTSSSESVAVAPPAQNDPSSSATARRNALKAFEFINN